MIFNDKTIYEFVIKDQKDTLKDIEEIVNTYYQLGKVKDVKKLTIGDSNFNYFVTIEKNGIETDYFGQLFSTSKSLLDLKYELALREYYLKNSKSKLECASSLPTKDGGYTVKCRCTEINRDRYFCIFTFVDGNSMPRDEWAYGKMSKELLRGCAKGIAMFHIGAYGFKPPEECESIITDYVEELALYRRIFTEDFERLSKNSTYEYYDYFREYQPRLLEILDKYTDSYLSVKNEIPNCICHMDTSPQNYMFDDNLQPIGVCDLDISKERPRLFDIGWFINEGLCKFDPKSVTNSINIDYIVEFLDAYDEAMKEAGNPKPGKLTRKERELVMDIYQLVSIMCGFYYIWDYILMDNPTNTYEFNTFWGNWTKTALEFVEDNMEEFKKRIVG